MNNQERINRIQKILLAKRTTPLVKPAVAKNLVQKIISGRSGIIKKTINQGHRIKEQAKNARPASVGRSTPFNDKVIFLSGGIGDIFSIESFIPEARKQSLSTVLCGTRKHQAIQDLFKALPNYPNLKEHRVMWSDFVNFWCFLYKTECENKFTRTGQTIPPILQAAEDYGIAIKFPVIRNGEWPYIGSSFLRHQVADIAHLGLSGNYIVLAPYSSDKANTRRDFTSTDWDATIALLHKRGQKGVVLNNGDDKVPKTDQLIDLSNKTSILESIEVVKKSTAYIGIDTCFSVLAAQLFDSRNLLIKCVNNHGLNNKAIYFAPHKTFEFITESVNGRAFDG